MSVLFSGVFHKWRQTGINNTSLNPLEHVLNAFEPEDHIIHVTLTSIPPPQQVSFKRQMVNKVKTRQASRLQLSLKIDKNG